MWSSAKQLHPQVPGSAGRWEVKSMQLQERNGHVCQEICEGERERIPRASFQCMPSLTSLQEFRVGLRDPFFKACAHFCCALQPHL